MQFISHLYINLLILGMYFTFNFLSITVIRSCHFYGWISPPSWKCNKIISTPSFAHVGLIDIMRWRIIIVFFSIIPVISFIKHRCPNGTQNYYPVTKMLLIVFAERHYLLLHSFLQFYPEIFIFMVDSRQNQPSL